MTEQTLTQFNALLQNLIKCLDQPNNDDLKTVLTNDILPFITTMSAKADVKQYMIELSQTLTLDKEAAKKKITAPWNPVDDSKYSSIGTIMGPVDVKGSIVYCGTFSPTADEGLRGLNERLSAEVQKLNSQLHHKSLSSLPLDSGISVDLLRSTQNLETEKELLRQKLDNEYKDKYIAKDLELIQLREINQDLNNEMMKMKEIIEANDEKLKTTNEENMTKSGLIEDFMKENSDLALANDNLNNSIIDKDKQLKKLEEEVADLNKPTTVYCESGEKY